MKGAQRSSFRWLRSASRAGWVIAYLWLLVPRSATARPNYAAELPGRLQNNCSVCHISPSGSGTLNNFGEAFGMSGHDFAPIAEQDTDGDGFTNDEELNAGTLPAD
ncbi:MAG: thrombospondin type 3 repeat-containing protein, partial [bacterium]